jgi:hypothetical protein
MHSGGVLKERKKEIVALPQSILCIFVNFYTSWCCKVAVGQ